MAITSINTRQPGNGRPGHDGDTADGALHPAWAQFLRFCDELQHGDIERLRIQDGLPVLAELAIRKVKFL